MKSLISKTAVKLGFCAAGITSADPVDEVAHLEDAIDNGRTASMKWLARNPGMRCDPKSLFPDAKSVICLAVSYGEKGIAPLSHDADMRRARYARGADYHDAVLEKLRKLWEAVNHKAPGARARFCVDTSPVMEKALAARAGLGWIGRHTVLVNERFGSWLSLGEIITDLDIEADAPARDLCGDCRACLDACPGGALLSSRVLDSRRCISFWTTMSKEAPPEEIRRRIPEGAYGCDLCQEACPYNRKMTMNNWKS